VPLVESEPLLDPDASPDDDDVASADPASGLRPTEPPQRTAADRDRTAARLVNVADFMDSVRTGSPRRC
jgi:hypothetical protein